jgi:signal recognition particle subunit SRP54
MAIQKPYTLVDFRTGMEQLKKLGPLKQVMSLVLGMGNSEDLEQELQQIEGIVDSMTPQERENPELIDENRCHRIAAGSGICSTDVKKLLKEFSAMARLMGQMRRKK